MMGRGRVWLALGVLPGMILSIAAPCQAEPTAVTVRVISQDAKFVGDHTGGVMVVLRNAETEAVLAEGRTEGGTGDTDLIMHSAGRGVPRAAPGTAAFNTVLQLDRPTLVRLEVLGPMGRPASVVRATAERWIMPGEPVTTGDGWVIELPGLAVTPRLSNAGREVEIAVTVEPLCGCPITPGGLWPAEDYRVSASLWSGNQRLGNSPLAFHKAPGEFVGKLPRPADPSAIVIIFARNVVTGATGLSQAPLPLPRP